MKSGSLGHVKTSNRTSMLARGGDPSGGFGISKAECMVTLNCLVNGISVLNIRTHILAHCDLSLHMHCRIP
jgi:hypothetical protein